MLENPWNVGSFQDFLFYNCPECIFKTKAVKLLEEHAICNHASNYTKANQDETSSDCDFTEDEAEKPLWHCQYCDRQFLLQPSLQEHFHQKHSRESRFDCDMCHFKSNVPLVTEQHKQGGYCVNTLPEKQSEEETMEASTSQPLHNPLEIEDDDHDKDFVNITPACTRLKKQTLRKYKRTWIEFKRIANVKQDSEPTQEDFAKYLTFKGEGSSHSILKAKYTQLNTMYKLIFKKQLSDYPELNKIVDNHSELPVQEDPTLEDKSLVIVNVPIEDGETSNLCSDRYNTIRSMRKLRFDVHNKVSKDDKVQKLPTLEVKSLDNAQKEDKSNEFECRFCDQKFEFYELLTHRAEVHHIVAEYLCEKCDFDTNVPSKLKLHQLEKHKSELDPLIELNQNTMTLYPNGFFANQNPSEHPIQQYMLKQHELEKESSTDDDPFESQGGDDDFVMEEEEESFAIPDGMQNEIDIDTEEYKETQAIYLCDLCSFKCNDIKEYEYHCATLCNHDNIEMEEQTKKQDTDPKETVLPDKPNEIDLQTDHCYSSNTFQDPVVQQEVEIETTFTTYFSRKPCNYSCKQCHYRTDSNNDFQHHLVLCTCVNQTKQLPHSKKEQIIEVKFKKKCGEVVKLKKKSENQETVTVEEEIIHLDSDDDSDRPNEIDLTTDHNYPSYFEKPIIVRQLTEQLPHSIEDQIIEVKFKKNGGKVVKFQEKANNSICIPGEVVKRNPQYYVEKPVNLESNGIHECYLCEGTSFTDKNLFIQHIILEHLYAEEHSCPLCTGPEQKNYHLKDYYFLLEHMATYHRKKMVLECYFCPQLFEMPRAMKYHMKTAHRMTGIEVKERLVKKCHLCYSDYLKVLEKDHMTSVHGVHYVFEIDKERQNGIAIHQCYLCEDTSFTKKGLFIQHLIEHHLLSEQNYQCTLCLNPEVFDGFEDYYSLLEHMVAYHDKKMVLECYCCPALFALPLALKEHLHKIHEVKGINEIRDKVFISCQHCGILIRQCFLKDHVRIRHNKGDGDSENTEDIMQQSDIENNEDIMQQCDSEATINCQHCGILIRQCFLKDHIRIRHNIQQVENVNKPNCEIEKGFRCRIKDCSFSTLERETFKAHLFTHKAFKCNDCWYITFEEEKFKDHLATHKPKIADAEVQQKVQNMIESTDEQSCFSGQEREELQKKYFATQSQRNYVLGEDVDICDICFKVMRIDNIRFHKENKHKLGNHPCLKCDEKFTSRRRLTNHIAVNHPEERGNTTCNFCDKKFKTPAGLLLHIQRTHPSDNAIFCPKCPWLRFGSENMYNRHVRKYHQIIFVCSVCEEMCTSRKGLIQHILEKHGIECSETDFYICPWCREKYSTCDGLNRHFHHEHKAPMEHECNKCDKKFSTKLFLTMHTMETHEFDFDSDSMTNNISIASALKIKDVKVVEEEIIERKFECSSCGKKLKSQRVLQDHFRQWHQPLTHNHFCHLCSYSTFEKFKLKKHLGEKHDIGEIKCKQCPHISSKYSLHQKHKKTHSGPRLPWKCTECASAAFRLRSKLANHMWIEHGVVFKYNKNKKD